MKDFIKIYGKSPILLLDRGREYRSDTKEIGELFGKTIEKIIVCDDDDIYFFTKDEEVYRMYHDQDCCEDVSIEEVIGQFKDLLDSPITMAEAISDKKYEEENASKISEVEEYGDIGEWTFYKLATVKGYVTIRWFGTSNGYYSTEVDFIKIEFINE